MNENSGNLGFKKMTFQPYDRQRYKSRVKHDFSLCKFHARALRGIIFLEKKILKLDY